MRNYSIPNAPRAKLIVVILLAGCSDSAPRETMRGADFSSMPACVASLEKNVGPLRVLSDSQDNFQCRTATDKACGCSKKESAAKGVYFQGWFMAD